MVELETTYKESFEGLLDALGIEVSESIAASPAQQLALCLEKLMAYDDVLTTANELLMHREVADLRPYLNALQAKVDVVAHAGQYQNPDWRIRLETVIRSTKRP
jgi:hypothetical protein